MKIRSILAMILAVSISVAICAQDGTKASSDSREIIVRLSEKNFRNIKLLANAIYNYGNGDEDFDLLVKTYSEASALYFSKDYEKSAKKFQENEKQIIEIASKLAEKYQEETESLQKEIIEKNVKKKIASDLSGNDTTLAKDKYVNQSTQAIIQANDYFERVRPIQAIQQYRLSRKRMLTYLYIEADELSQEEIDKCKKDKYTYDKCIKTAKKERREEVRQQYEKLIKDNENQRFISKEKEN